MPDIVHRYLLANQNLLDVQVFNH